MKNYLISLVDQIEDIRKLAHEEHISGFFESDFVIYDVPEFITWKKKIQLELEHIRIKTKFIYNTITIIDEFDGDVDRQKFNELAGALSAIVDNIDYYYNEQDDKNEIEKPQMIFISHSSSDKEYISAFVELLEALGLREDEIVCSSIPPYCVPLDGKVYEWLVDKFQNCQLHVIYMLSHHYYNSVASLNEMGAAWAMKQKWSAVLLPGFGFDEIAGCIDSDQIGIKLDDSDIATLKFRLEELKEELTTEFNLQSMSPTVWERKRDNFLNKIVSIKNELDLIKNNALPEGDSKTLATKSYGITKDACILLIYAADDPQGEVMIISSVIGTSVSTGIYNFTKNESAREVARWTSAVEELLLNGYIQLVGRKDKIYRVTNRGYMFSNQLKSEFIIDTSYNPEEYIED